MGNISDKIVEKIKTHIKYNFFSPENHAFNKIIWQNMVQPDRPEVTNDNIIQRMRFTCWLTTAISSHAQYVILFHCKNGFANALQCRIILPFPVFFSFIAEPITAERVLSSVAVYQYLLI